MRVSEELKRRMRRFPHVNWSEIARRAIEERLSLEEKLEERPINVKSLERAIAIQDELRAKSSGKWYLSREIIRWRRRRR